MKQKYSFEEPKKLYEARKNISQMAVNYSEDKVAFVADDGWIWIHEFKSSRNIQLVQGRTPQWSPDNTSIIFVRDGMIFECLASEGAKEKMIQDGKKFGRGVRLSNPKISVTGSIILRCQNSIRGQNDMLLHYFAKMNLQENEIKLLQIEDPASDGNAIWDKNGIAFLLETRLGTDSVIHIVNESLSVEASYLKTFRGNFSPNAEKMACFSVPHRNDILVCEKNDETWLSRPTGFTRDLKEISRNQIHWLSNSVLCYEYDSKLNIADIETGNMMQSSYYMEGLSKRGIPSICWFPQSQKFVFETSEENSACLYLTEYFLAE